ncbi:MAG: hypothetical protein AAF384_15765 [Pseudomonadota bacterium]
MPGSGTITLPVAIADITLSDDPTLVLPAAKLYSKEFDPLTSTRNFDNEFGWTYDILVTGVSGAGLTFVDGVLTSIDVVIDLHIDMLFGGDPTLWNPPFTFGGRLNPGFDQASSLTISGATLTYNFDQSTTQDSFLGNLGAVRLVATRTGTIDAVTSVTPPGPTRTKIPTLPLAAIVSLAFLLASIARRKWR